MLAAAVKAIGADDSAAPAELMGIKVAAKVIVIPPVPAFDWVPVGVFGFGFTEADKSGIVPAFATGRPLPTGCCGADGDVNGKMTTGVSDNVAGRFVNFRW